MHAPRKAVVPGAGGAWSEPVSDWMPEVRPWPSPINIVPRRSEAALLARDRDAQPTDMRRVAQRNIGLRPKVS